MRPLLVVTLFLFPPSLAIAPAQGKKEKPKEPAKVILAQPFGVVHAGPARDFVGAAKTAGAVAVRVEFAHPDAGGEHDLGRHE